MKTSELEPSAVLPSIEEMFEHFLENSPIYVFFKDDDGRAIRLSRNYEQLLGKPLQELLEKPVEDLFPPELAQSMVADDRRVLKEGKPITIEEEFNGRLYSTTKFPIIPGGTPSFLAGFTRDITESGEREREIRESEEKYRNLFSAMNCGCMVQQVVFDKSGIPDDFYTFDMNPAAERLLGVRREDVVNKSAVSLLPPEEFKNWLSHFGKVAAGGDPVHYEHYSQHYGKHFKGHVFCPRAGQFAVIFDDVTAEKTTEATVQNTQKLESLGLLAGGIAHDFNNLFGGIFGYIDLASEVTGEPRVAGYLEKALSAIDRARGLTRQLLTFAKGGVPIMKTGRLFPFVQETAQSALAGSNVACRFDVPPDLWECAFDREQIVQVIENIVINALQAMPDGGSIEVSAMNCAVNEKEHAVLAQGNYVKITVKDHGCGIPKETIHRIFDPFYTTKPKGHGLGLAACHSIIHRHGGCIDVESEPGKGSSFHLYLPVSIESAATAPEKTEVCHHKGSGTFLVVDDEEAMRETIGDMLKSLGYTVVSFENGRDAVDFFNKEFTARRPIAGLIVDLTVPGGMGGKEAIGEIRKLSRETPVFVASGYAEDPVIAQPQKYGFTGSICKPLIKNELVKMLNRGLGKKL